MYMTSHCIYLRDGMHDMLSVVSHTPHTHCLRRFAAHHHVHRLHAQQVGKVHQLRRVCAARDRDGLSLPQAWMASYRLPPVALLLSRRLWLPQQDSHPVARAMHWSASQAPPASRAPWTTKVESNTGTGRGGELMPRGLPTATTTATLPRSRPYRHRQFRSPAHARAHALPSLTQALRDGCPASIASPSMVSL